MRARVGRIARFGYANANANAFAYAFAYAVKLVMIYVHYYIFMALTDVIEPIGDTYGVYVHIWLLLIAGFAVANMLLTTLLILDFS